MASNDAEMREQFAERFRYPAQAEHLKLHQDERFRIDMLAYRLLAQVNAGNVGPAAIPVFDSCASNGDNYELMLMLAGLQDVLGLDQGGQPNRNKAIKIANRIHQELANEAMAARATIRGEAGNK